MGGESPKSNMELSRCGVTNSTGDKAEQKQNSSSPLATSPVKSKSDSNNGSPEKVSNDNVDMIESQNANNIKNSENLNQAKGKKTALTASDSNNSTSKQRSKQKLLQTESSDFKLVFI